MHEACRLNDVEKVRALLADPKVDPGFSWNRALYISVYWGNASVVEELVSDCRVNVNDRNGFIVAEAIRKKNSRVALLLITHPCFDPSIDDQGPIFWAADYDQTEITRVLLANPRVIAVDAIKSAKGKSRVLLATHEKWGMTTPCRTLYEQHHPELTRAYDAVTTLCWVAKQLQNTWSDMVEPMAERLKIVFKSYISFQMFKNRFTFSKDEAAF